MDAAAPHPPRFWWLKRLAALGVFCLLALVGLRLYWGHAMSDRLEAAVAEIEARGEPIRFEDMLRDPVPDGDNAAHHLMQAMAQWPMVDGIELVIHTDWHHSLRHGKSLTSYADPVADDDAYLRRCGTSFDGLRSAREAPDVVWPITRIKPNANRLNQTAHRMGFASPQTGWHINAVTLGKPHLGDMRQLGRLIQDASRRAHRRGDDRLAFELVQHMWLISQAMGEHADSTLESRVAISIQAMTTAYLEEMLPTLTIRSDAHPRGAEPEQVRALTQALSDDPHHRAMLRRGLTGERWALRNVHHGLLSRQIPWSYMTRWPVPRSYSSYSSRIADHTLTRIAFAPLVSASALEALERSTDLINDFDRSNRHAEYRRSIDSHPYMKREPLSLVRFHHTMNHEGAMIDATSTYFKLLTQTRMAAAALAIKLYEHDHGHRPDTLAELVPGYLPEVPLDPLAPTPREIGYLPGGVQPVMDDVRSTDATARPALAERRFAVLYSVGENGNDRGGRCHFNRDGTLLYGYSTITRESGDEVFHLDPSPEPLS